MPLPTMTGMIERRLLINYRVQPDVLARFLPEPFRAQLVGGLGVAGICLIRLGDLRPSGLPSFTGLTSENAAHRVAVEWDGPDGPLAGVYIPRRDSSSRVTALVGGRLFPGAHHRARFWVEEGGGDYAVGFESLDGTGGVEVRATITSAMPAGSVFASVPDASAFFEAAPLGYSATRRPGELDGVELACTGWRVEPLAVSHVRSSFFEDETLFPPGTAELDSGLLMSDLPAVWKARQTLRATPIAAARDPSTP